MDNLLNNEQYEIYKAREAAFSKAVKESNKWAKMAKPIQEKQISSMLHGNVAPLTLAERVIMQSAQVATEKLAQAMELYMSESSV